MGVVYPGVVEYLLEYSECRTVRVSRLPEGQEEKTVYRRNSAYLKYSVSRGKVDGKRTM